MEYSDNRIKLTKWHSNEWKYIDAMISVYKCYDVSL